MDPVELSRRGEYSIWVEESGVGPMSELQRCGIIFGCLVLIGFLTFFIYQVYNKAAHKVFLINKMGLNSEDMLDYFKPLIWHAQKSSTEVTKSCFLILTFLQPDVVNL